MASSGQRLSIFDLDALREDFLKSVHENNVKDTEWGEHARWFIQQVVDHDLSAVTVSEIIGRGATKQLRN